MLFIGVLFIWPFDKQYAYRFIANDCSDKGAWIYDRIFYNQQPVDIALIGSSRTKAYGIETVMEDSLRKHGLALSVANFGYCRWGRNMDHTLIKDILKAHKIKYLILELHEEEERLSHIDFGYIADSRDVVAPVLFFDQQYFRDIYNAILVRFDIFRHRLLCDRREFGISNDDHSYGYSMEKASSVVLAEALKGYKRAEKYKDSRFEKWINYQYPIKYLEKISAMAKENGIKIFFLYLPGYGSPEQPSNTFDYCKEFGPVFIIPQGILGDPGNWRDGGHFNDSGAIKTISWLSGQIAPYMK